MYERHEDERVVERIADVLDSPGVLGVQGDALDREYLASWAKKLGLEALLSRAIAEAQT